MRLLHREPWLGEDETQPASITTAMQLYFSGEGLPNTARSLRPNGNAGFTSDRLLVDMKVGFSDGEIPR